MTKGEQTRRKIVAAAAPIFNKRGYEGSSLADLMAATGLKKGGIYRHFSSKEELAAEAFDYTWEAAWKARMHHVDVNAPGVEPIKQLITDFVNHRSPVAGGCPLLNTAIDADDGNAVLRARVSRALRTLVTRLQKMLKRAAERGEIRPDVDTREVATLILSLLEGALMITSVERNNYALQRAGQHLNHYLDTAVALLPERAGSRV
ncbi:MAG TPA: TetR/AcrR family transcriptional regulator [Bryobacteraceae bacterium]|nr:TetR/AcrR family transcriptional regulator [Bryobacteraceae bacterium]